MCLRCSASSFVSCCLFCVPTPNSVSCHESLSFDFFFREVLLALLFVFAVRKGEKAERKRPDTSTSRFSSLLTFCCFRCCLSLFVFVLALVRPCFLRCLSSCLALVSFVCLSSCFRFLLRARSFFLVFGVLVPSFSSRSRLLAFLSPC